MEITRHIFYCKTINIVIFSHSFWCNWYKAFIKYECLQRLFFSFHLTRTQNAIFGLCYVFLAWNGLSQLKYISIVGCLFFAFLFWFWIWILVLLKLTISVVSRLNSYAHESLPSSPLLSFFSCVVVDWFVFVLVVVSFSFFGVWSVLYGFLNMFYFFFFLPPSARVQSPTHNAYTLSNGNHARATWNNQIDIILCT